MIWASTVGYSLFNTRATCPEKRKKHARPDWTWLLSVSRDVLGAILFYPKGKKWPWPDSLWRTELNFLISISFFHQINMTACHVSKNYLKGLNCVISISRQSCKGRDLLSRQNNRLKWCKQQRKTDSLPFLALNIWDHYVVQGWMEASRAGIKSKKIIVPLRCLHTMDHFHPLPNIKALMWPIIIERQFVLMLKDWLGRFAFMDDQVNCLQG